MTALQETLGRAGVQYMSAGKGVQHSEQNAGDVPVRFIQCWVMPRSRSAKPAYGGLAGGMLRCPTLFHTDEGLPPTDNAERAARRRGAFEHVVQDKSAEADHAPVKVGLQRGCCTSTSSTLSKCKVLSSFLFRRLIRIAISFWARLNRMARLSLLCALIDR
jgi:hypothetical protein